MHNAVLHLAIYSHNKAEAQVPVRDLDQIRGFLTSAGPIAIVDMPWMPVFLILCFLIHPWLGCVALVGGLLLIGITFLNERASRVPARAAANDAALRTAMIEADRRNSESVRAMGMGAALGQALDQDQRPIHPRAGARERCRQQLRQHLEGGAAHARNRRSSASAPIW